MYNIRPGVQVAIEHVGVIPIYWWTAIQNPRKYFHISMAYFVKIHD